MSGIQTFTLVAKDPTGFRADLDLTNQMPYFLTEYEGLDAPNAEILSSQMYNMAGAAYNGSHTAMRNIVLNFYMFQEVPRYRNTLYLYFQVGRQVNLEYQQAVTGFGTLTRTIETIVESINFSQFNAPERAKQVIQISLICPDPYLKGAQQTGSTSGAGSVVYSGEAPCGIQFTTSQRNNFSVSVTHSGVTETLTLKNSTYTSLAVDTQKHTIIKNGSTNAINLWEHGSVWLTLKPGSNTVVAKSGTSSVTLSYTYTPLYQGV